MQLIDGKPVYSATDLVGFLECEHLTNLERAALAGLVTRPIRLDPQLDLVRRRGFDHEARYLQGLEASGHRVTKIVPDTSEETPEGSRVSRGERLRQQADATEAAIRRGDDVIYQAAFFDGRWLGYADFLVRIEEPSDLGPYKYEITDTKLAHEVRASALLQLCTYAELLARIQGDPPRHVTVALGGGERRVERHRIADYVAFYRSLKRRFEAAAAIGDARLPVYPPAETYPDPVDHCAVCRWWAVCSDRRRADDDLSLVAGLTSGQRRRLPEHGAPTRRALARFPLPPPRIEGTSREAVTRVREQARVQVKGEDEDRLISELIEPDRGEDGAFVRDRGFASLPPPAPGDLFLDFEGDPFAFDDGLEYLVGIAEPGPALITAQPTLGLLPPDPGIQPTYLARWALNPAEEKLAFQWLIDFIVERRRRDPRLHVFHYGSYERGRVARLSTRHATREEEVDALLRDGVFVDLYRVVRQAIRASVESYSIKRLEELYGFTREVELREADKSIVEFERYLEDGGTDATILAQIEAYNRDDCISTWRLRDWLEARRGNAVDRWGDLPRAGVNEPAPVEETEARRRTRLLAERLVAGAPAERSQWTPEQEAAALLGNLLDWHWREEKSTYWRFFELLGMDDDDLVDQKEPIVGLVPVEDVGETKLMVIRKYAFEPQDNDVDDGDELYDPHVFDANVWNKVGSVDDINQTEGWIVIRRPKASTDPEPTIVVPRRHISTAMHHEALLEVADWVVEHGIRGEGPYRAARDLLLRATPRLGQVGGGRLPAEEEVFGTGAALVAPGETGQEAALRHALALDGTTLAIQGPPGSGKTTTGAAMILDLVVRGRTVGIAALSHKVISNLLDEVMTAAARGGVPLRAAQRSDPRETPWPIEFVSSAKARAALESGAMVLAGTSWLWTGMDLRQAVDTLVVDEAGQMSLANVIAMSRAARNIVLLGDPQQLEQPLQGSHPPGADASALEHVIGDEQTIQPHRGLFLEHTWRLHPEICAFTSELFYEDRLESQPGLDGQRIETDGPLSGSGLRWLPIAHEGNRNQSTEEVEAVASLVRQLADGSTSFVDGSGRRAPVTLADVLIVAPYNAQVAALIRRLPPRARVGTVDKFQGQQAPIVVYSMATSTPQEAPRGMEFLYSLNRLNVATSRARALVILLCSPELLRADVHTPRQLRLANALCRYVELAEQVDLEDVLGPARSHSEPVALVTP